MPGLALRLVAVLVSVRVKAARMSSATARPSTTRGTGAMRENPALVQHDDVVVGGDLIDQMRCPERAERHLRDQAAHMLEDIRS